MDLMEYMTTNPTRFWAYVAFLVVAIGAGIARWAVNIRDDIEDWQEEKAAKKAVQGDGKKQG